MPKITRKLRFGKARDYFIKKTFLIWQALGFHISLNNYYSPVPDTRTLKENLWSRHSELVGVNINEKKQLELSSLFMSKFRIEYDKFPKNRTSTLHEYYVNNRFFGSVAKENI